MADAVDTSSTFSGWIDPPPAIQPAATGELECDVAVVGGGYTGMAAALRLVAGGADVALLEAEFCGWGASSRNAGHLTPTVVGDPQLLATVYRRRARELIRFADAAVHFTEGMIEGFGIDCEYEAVGNVSAALSKGQLRRSERNAEFLAGVGGEVEFVSGEAAGLPATFAGGILERAGGVLNPGRFARGLREALLGTGAAVHEGAPVTRLERRGSRFELVAGAARVRAGQVLVATNAYTRDLPFSPPRIVVPLWITLAETEPVAPDRLAATGWTRGAGIYTQHLILESYRPTARGTIVFGSRRPQAQRGPVGTRRPEHGVVADIVRGFRERFPSLDDVAISRAWGGWIAMTPSWLPVAGEIEPGLFYAVGYNGHGLAQAPYVGSLVADRMSGSAPSEDLGVVWRDGARFLPSPVFSAPALRLGWSLDRAADRLAARRG